MAKTRYPTTSTRTSRRRTPTPVRSSRSFALIRSIVPDVEEGISYGVPFYKHHGEFGGFAAYKGHVSFGFGSDVLEAEDRAALEAGGYKLGKGTMQIRFDQDVPAPRNRQILRGEGEDERGRGLYVTRAAATARRRRDDERRAGLRVRDHAARQAEARPARARR